MFISFFDVNIVEAPAYIHFGKVPITIERVEKCIDSRKGIFVGDGSFVDPMIVLHEVFFSVLFQNTKERGSMWGFQWSCMHLVARFLLINDFTASFWDPDIE